MSLYVGLVLFMFLLIEFGGDLMDFIDELKQLSKRFESLKDKLPTEESTKMSMIMPFFQLLGYDVFNPHEFLPEFTADVGIKKGEKVDYAIFRDGKPVILIEAKWCGESLDKHGSQLFRYFGTTPAKFGILTNGIIYRFYTDLEEQNKMDAKPFLEIDMSDIRDWYAVELKKFHKDSYDEETIFNAASELKYSNEIKQFMDQQLKNPSEVFVTFILSQVYSGRKTQSVIEKFRGTVKKSLNTFVNELMNDKITLALKTNADSEENAQTAATVEPAVEKQESKIITTSDEIEAFYIIRNIARGLVHKDLISYRDTESYFGILYDDNSRKWICRLKLDGSKKYLYLPTEDKGQETYQIENVDDVYKYEDKIKSIIRKHANLELNLNIKIKDKE